MGIVRLSCRGGCSCLPHNLDAHAAQRAPAARRGVMRPARLAYVRNESVWSTHEFEVRGRSAECQVRITLLQNSSSGGTKFKVRWLTLSSGIATS